MKRTKSKTTLSGVWQVLWPKLLAIVIVVLIWEGVYWLGLRPSFVLPSPGETFRTLVAELATPRLWSAMATTLGRAIVGFSIAAVIGTALGLAVSSWRTLRLAVGSLITGLQTMPSIAWFPFAILLFGLSEQAIFFVIVLGATPSIANGLISGIDHVPPAYRKLGQVLGARGFALYRHIIFPASLPAYVSGLTQGWAFAWRSLMAGELLVIIASKPSLGETLEFARQFSNAPLLLATMIVILILGMLVDGLFSMLARQVRRRRGLLAE